MRALANIRLFGLALACVLATAFAAVGGAHHVPTEREIRLEAWLLSGGSSDDLCGHEAVAAHGCPVCHLVAAAIVPDPFTVAAPLPRMAEVAALPVAQPRTAPARDPTLYLRGPPVLS